MALEFHVGEFEGPLDLLLFLISKHKMDIADIEISLLLDQYLDFHGQDVLMLYSSLVLNNSDALR